MNSSHQKHFYSKLLILLIGIFVISACALTQRVEAGKLQSATKSQVPELKKTMIIIFENTDYDKALAQPFFNQIAKKGALLSNFNAEIHPSQANYIALISGTTNGVVGDGSQDVDAPNLVDLLEAKQKTWKVYAEKYPGNCFTGKVASTYVRKHNPFISFKNIQKNPTRCANIVDATQLDIDIAANNLADFLFYVPDLNNDGHDTDVAYADRWFSKDFGPRLQNPLFNKNLTMFVTFDESASYFGNHIYTAVYGDSVKAGSMDSSRYDHYSLLRTIEEGMGLGNLGQNDTKSAAITNIWK